MAEGERGARGDRGIHGERGPKGDHGQHGDKGAAGQPGAPASDRKMLIFCALVVLYMTFIFVQVQRNDDKIADVAYTNLVESCERANKVRDELNSRIPQHTKDALNLADLTGALSRTRAAESQAFQKLGEEFDIGDEVTPLVDALRGASLFDAKVAASQRKIQFDRTPLINCRRVVERDH